MSECVNLNVLHRASERGLGEERERTLLNKEEGMLRYECPRQNSVTQFKDDGVGTNA